MPRKAAALRLAAGRASLPAGAGGSSWLTATNAGLALIGVSLLALAVYALGWHRIGDTAAESDFYSGYVFGARELMRGRLDFGRFGVFGPVYEALLALVGLLVPDLYMAARLLSVLAVGATMLAWWAVARSRFDATAALALVALLALNPTFMRYGYSATTDSTAFALYSLSAWATLVPARRWQLALAGALAALATLTRYNLATLLPAGVLLLALGASRPPRERVRAILVFLAGALVVLLPWTLASLAAGHVPGITLLRDRGYYGAADPAGVLENRYRDIEAGIGAAPPAEAGGPPAPVLWRLVTGIGPHFAHDATELLGLPVTALVLAGLVAALVRGRWRAFMPCLPLAVFTFLPLAPVYYAVRYSMVLLPLYLLPAAWLLSMLAHAPWRRSVRVLATAALALAVTVPTALWALASHREWLANLPVEMRTAGEAVRARVTPGGRLLARKAHAAYYAGLSPTAFPLVSRLETLAGYCRAQQVAYLYYSGIEARARPAFAYLLDTSATVPGLAALYANASPPCVLYRIGPDFGALPAWWPDPAVRQRVSARVNVLLQPGPQTRPLLLRLAQDELQRGRPGEALRDAEAAATLQPGAADARLLVAEALRQMGRADAAIDTLRAVLALAPDDVAARLGLGLLLREAGRNAEAGEAWRPLVEFALDPRVLRQMDSLYTQLGDAPMAGRVREALAAANAAPRSAPGRK